MADGVVRHDRIVRENYPVSKLPDELREGIPDGAQVIVTVTVEDPPLDAPLTLDEIFARARPVFSSGKDVDDYVRAMREESD